MPLRCLLSSGCTLGPRQIDASRIKYNESIQRTFQEEILLNLVRLKYRETPEFVSIGGVAAQYTWNGAAAVDAGLLEGAPTAFGIDAVIRREERPTISYAPQRSADFNRGMLSPISIETLALLARTGWAADRILRCTVQSINGVDNATSAGGPTPDWKPEFEEFRYLAQQIRQLQIQHAVEIAQADKEEVKVLPVSVQELDGDFFLGAMDQGYKFKQDESGRWQMYEKDQFAALIFKREVLHSPEVRDITGILGLKPGCEIYKVELAKKGQIQPTSSDVERLPPPHDRGPFQPCGTREDLTVSTRSLLETMYFLSQGIRVPVQHIEQGLVTRTLDHNGYPFDWTELTGDLLQVFSSHHKPKCAAVAIPYRGHWYYIDDRDLNSQSTFVLLAELFSIEVRSGGGSRLPVLTLGL